MRNGNDLDVLGKLKRLLAATPAGVYAVSGVTRKLLEDTVNELAALRVALELTERGRSADVQRGMGDQLLVDPEE